MIPQNEFLSRITSTITGHEREPNHFAPARMSAPCASHCYHASVGSEPTVQSAWQANNNSNAAQVKREAFDIGIVAVNNSRVCNHDVQSEWATKHTALDTTTAFTIAIPQKETREEDSYSTPEYQPMYPSRIMESTIATPVTQKRSEAAFKIVDRLPSM